MTSSLIPRMGAYISSEVHDAEGIATLTWHTGESGVHVKTLSYHPYPFGAPLMHPGRSHLLMIWEKLDACLDMVFDPIASQAEINGAKARGGAFAEVLAQLMSPFYNSRDAVTQEAVNRYHARKAGTEHETPGLAEVHWNPRPITDAERNAGATRTVEVVELPDNKKAFVKHALETGSMDAKTLADMMGVSIEVIKHVMDS